MRTRHGRILAAAAALVFAGAACTGTFRASLRSDGGEANGQSFSPALDRTGRVVAFASDATNLVAGDTNGATDVFARDTQQNTTTLVSQAGNGAHGNGPSSAPSVSADGRYVAFTSAATNLVAGDDNGESDVFVRDLQTNATRVVSKAPDGGVAGGASNSLDISDDGSKILFRSVASDLVPSSNGEHIYLADLATNTVTRVSSASLCAYDERRYIVQASLTGDASRIAYGIACFGVTTDYVTPGELVLVVRDRVNNTNTVVWSFRFDEQPFDTWYFGSVSYARGGSAVAWEAVHNISVHGYFYQPYVWTGSGTPQQLDLDQGGATELALSPDGRYVVYSSPLPDYISNLPHSKVRLYDRSSGARYLVSVDQYGNADDDTPNGNSVDGVFSGDGRQLAFTSYADDVVADDTNAAADVFTRSLDAVLQGSDNGGTQRVSG